MPPRVRLSKKPVTATHGSHESAADIAEIMPEQHAVLAAAAIRKSGAAPATARAGIKKRTPNHAGKKVFIFNKLEAEASSSSGGGHRRGGKNKLSPAVMKVIRAKYQKGDFKDTLSGAVYFRGKPRFGKNEVFKGKVQPNLLAEGMRWNDEMKLYTAKVYTPEQVIKIRESMKTVSKEGESDLTESAPTDDEIFEVFDFDERKSVDIRIIAEFNHDGENTVAIGGATYPFKNILMKEGFEFDGVTTYWHAPEGTETEEIQAMMEEFGFNVELFDVMQVAA